MKFSVNARRSCQRRGLRPERGITFGFMGMFMYVSALWKLVIGSMVGRGRRMGADTEYNEKTLFE